MIGGIPCLQLQQLPLQLRQFLLQRLRIAAGERTLPVGDLLRQQGVIVGLVLLRFADGLGVEIELGIQYRQLAHVAVEVRRQLSHVEFLEGGQLGILLVQRLLGVIHLAAEKIGGALRDLGPGAQVFIHDQRGHGIANLLRAGGIGVVVRHVESRERHPPLRSSR